MEEINFDTATMEELVAYCNANRKKQVTGFTDLPTAQAEAKKLAETIAKWEAKKAETAARNAAKEAERLAALGDRDPRSAGVAESWNKPDVREKRRERNRCGVTKDGKTVVFQSVGDAFFQLGLPMKHLVKFRMELKASGKDTEFGYDWEIMPREATVNAPKRGDYGSLVGAANPWNPEPAANEQEAEIAA